MTTLEQDADQLHRRVLTEAVPLASHFRGFRAGATALAPDAAPALHRLAVVLLALFDFPVTLGLRPPSPPPRHRAQPRRRLTVREALREGPSTTWAAAAEELAAEPR